MRLGIDLGGTKTEIIAIDEDGTQRLRQRVTTPTKRYDDVVIVLRDLVCMAEQQLGRRGSVGLAIPGTLSARNGLIKNANSTILNGHAIDRDLKEALGRPLRIANDANCFALSEATDGAASGSNVVFGVIAGTGVGGGICVGGRLIEGPHRIAGEWGHNPLPDPRPDELPGPACYCGRTGCIETWISGPALARDFHRRTGRSQSAEEINLSATAGDEAAGRVMLDFVDRFARSIATVINILDPDAVVLGGGLSNLPGLADQLARQAEAYSFMPEGSLPIRKNVHGDSSGVRGAAWLWRPEELELALPS